MDRKAYPSDVSDEESYLTLMTEDAPQREFPLHEVFNGLRRIVRTGAQWRLMSHDLAPWHVVYQQSQRWIKAGVFESLVPDLRAVLRIAEGRKEGPTAAILDGRALFSGFRHPDVNERCGGTRLKLITAYNILHRTPCRVSRSLILKHDPVILRMVTLFSKKHLASLSRFVLKALRDKDKQWLFQNSRGERFDLASELDSGRIILKMSTRIPKGYKYSETSRRGGVTEYNTLIAE
jgi:transposase